LSIAYRIDRLPLGSFHWRLLAVSGVGNTFRSMNVGIISYILASLIADWNLTPEEAGAVGSIGIAGMVAGVALVGALADRLGRRFMFGLAVVVYTAATALSALSWNLLSLLSFRFVTGIGLGGGHPPMLTLVSELSPARHRGQMVMLLEVFWTFGSVIAALVAYLVIPSLGWRMAFVCGAIPILYAAAIYRLLPESPRFLLDKGRLQEAEDTVRSIEAQSGVEHGEALRPLSTNGAGSAISARGNLSELFSGEYLKRTACLWILWFISSYAYNGIFVWLPSLVVSAGFSIVDSFQFMLIITLAQLPGTVVAGVLVDRIGRKRTLVPFLLLCGISCYLFGLSTSAESILLWGSLISFFMLGSRGLTSAFTAELYPTRLRSTGVGSAGAFGRLVGIVAPMGTGVIVAQTGGGFGFVFIVFALVLLLGGLDVAILGEETAGQSLEELSA